MLIDIIAIKLKGFKQQYNAEMGMNQTELQNLKREVRRAKPFETLENFYVSANGNY